MTYDPHQNRKYVGIIVDRNGPDNSCKVLCPEIHGKDVNVDDLGWSRFTQQPTAEGGSVSAGTPDNGQLVTCIVNTTGASNLVEITGLYQTKQTDDPSNPNNLSLVTALPQWQTALNAESPIRVPPQSIQEQMQDGAKVRVPQERNQMWKHSLVFGLNSSAAQSPINGIILPGLTVGTAVEPSSSSFSSDMQASMGLNAGISIGFGGFSFSVGLGSISASLSASTSGVSIDASLGLSPALSLTLGSTLNLMTTVQTMPTEGSYQQPPIDHKIFMQNAKNLLSNANTQSDISNAIFQLTTNTSLQSNTAAHNTISTGPYGDMSISIDPLSGGISINLSNAATQSQSDFSSMLSSIMGADGDMFGNSSAVIQSMGERLADAEKKTEFQQRLQMNASNNSGTPARVAADQAAIAFLSLSVTV